MAASSSAAASSTAKQGKPKAVEPKPKPEPKVTEAKVADAPVPSADLIARLRAAKTVDDAVAILAPSARAKAKVDAVYELNTSCTEPLPQKRGACHKVYAVAVRLNAPFKVADIASALPDVKAAPYWTRRLAKTGHLVEHLTER